MRNYSFDKIRKKNYFRYSQGRSVGSIRYEGCKIKITTDGESSIDVTGTEVYRTSTEYDTKGRVHSSIDALGNITIYEYDNLDRQVIVKQANGLVTETVYDSQGRVWKSIVKAGDDVRTTEYKYD
ncbi:MAG: RHS repeat protein, partial [Planctomycetaceae bacterium]|nr:RHS repeat protein [Planctomycetaceae bacterium]